MVDNPAAVAPAAGPDAGAAGTPAPAAAPVSQPAPDWRTSLDADIAEHPSMADFKNPGDLAKSWVNAQKLIGGDKIPIPGQDATPEEWGIVYDRLGRPQNLDGYVLPEVAMPEGYPETDPNLVKGFKEQCHANGILPGQAAKMYEWFQGQQAGAYTGMMNERGASQTSAETGLRSEWGKAYEPNLAMAQNVLKQFGDENLTAYLEQSGAGNDPHLIRFLANVGKNFGEDGLTGQRNNFTKAPDEAKAEINAVLGNKEGAYFKKEHPEHAMMVKKMEDLHKMAYPEAMQG